MTERKPPIQNIPLRTDGGRAMMEAFVLSQLRSWGIVDIDYATLERRFLEHMEGEDP